MVYSASTRLSYELYEGNSYRFLSVQLVACVLGLIGMIAASYVPYRYYDQYAKQILLFSILILLLVYTPLGYSVRSETGREFHRWVRIAGIQFQPVELAKLGLVIYVSHFLSHKHDRIRRLTQGILPNMLILSVVFVLLYKQPDFGSAVLLSLVVVVLLFVGGARLSQIILLGGIAGFFIYASIQGDAYKMQRLQDFLASMQSSSYSLNHQVTRSVNAMALGGLFGAGIGNSIYKLFYLPYPHTDFIFAILSEELGFLGGAGVIGLFMLLIWRGIHISLRVIDSFASLLAIGITLLIGLQTVVNIGVVTGMMPTKGITLPFISYGGSSLLFSLVNIGILLNISRKRCTGEFVRGLNP
jgi:cell division protein FtsW